MDHDGRHVVAPGGAACVNVLIIDDDADIRDWLQAVAEQAGCRVRARASYAELPAGAVPAADVIFLDLSMPVADGVEVLRTLAAESCSAGIVLISASEEQVLRSAAQLAVSRGLRLVTSLRKPFTDRQLRSAIAAAFSGPREPRTVSSPSRPVSPGELHKLVEEHRLLLHYQPKMLIADGGICGVEALARCHHPQYGVLPAGSFVPMAERSGLIDAVTEQIMRDCFRQLGHWQREGLCVFTAINVSARSLRSVTLPDRIEALAREYRVDPFQVTLEVTESWFISNPVMALDVLTRLRLKGFRLSIDDYGTGNATLERLSDLPLNELKLDRRFVHDARHDPTARAIIASTVDLARTLGLGVVAEGVETALDWDYVESAGFDTAQGYYIARPMPGEHYPDWLAAHNPKLGADPA